MFLIRLLKGQKGGLKFYVSINAQSKTLGLNLKSQKYIAEYDKPLGAVAFLCILVLTVCHVFELYHGSVTQYYFALFFYCYYTDLLPELLYNIKSQRGIAMNKKKYKFKCCEFLRNNNCSLRSKSDQDI